MEYIIKFIYGFILPPGFFVTALALLGVWFHRKRNRAAYPVWAAGLLLYLYLIPLTGALLLHPLENAYQPPDKPTGDVLVMLGGGATRDTPDLDGKGNLAGSPANRLLTVYRLYRQTHLPIILSGGQVYADSGTEADIARRQLIAMGIPENKIIAENKSITTTTNAENTKKILKAHNYKRPVLVTSAFHMRRAVMNFEQNGVRVVPYPSDYLISRDIALYPGQFVPTGGFFAATAIKEYVGMLALLF